MDTITINGREYSPADIEANCTPINVRLNVGGIVEYGGCHYIVARMAQFKYALISLDDGNRWSDPVDHRGHERSIPLSKLIDRRGVKVVADSFAEFRRA